MKKVPLEVLKRRIALQIEELQSRKGNKVSAAIESRKKALEYLEKKSPNITMGKLENMFGFKYYQDRWYINKEMK